LKTVTLNTKTRITAPGFNLDEHNRLRTFLDISDREIVIALINPQNELILLQHFTCKANEHANEAISVLANTEPVFAQSYESVHVCYSGNVYTLVPGALYSNENKAEMLAFNHTVTDQMLVLADEMPGSDSYCVYGIDKSLKKTIDTLFSNNTLKHKVFCLAENLAAVSSRTHKTCLVHVQANTVDIALYDKKLWFFNTFEFQAAEDFLYFVLASLEQNTFSLEETEVVLAGEIEAGSALYVTLKQYLPKIKFAIGPKSLIKKDDFAKLPEHFYYALFNLFLCAS
jgi:hypothetical protein